MSTSEHEFQLCRPEHICMEIVRAGSLHSERKQRTWDPITRGRIHSLGQKWPNQMVMDPLRTPKASGMVHRLQTSKHTHHSILSCTQSSACQPTLHATQPFNNVSNQPAPTGHQRVNQPHAWDTPTTSITQQLQGTTPQMQHPSTVNTHAIHHTPGF